MDRQISNIREILSRELAALAERIRQQHTAAGQVASGRTLASIREEVIGDDVSVRGIIYGRFPFGTLETGRQPGAVPKNFVSIIRQWIIDKGISVQAIPYKRQPSDKWQPKYTPQERGELSLAGAIAYKIRTQGTRLYRTGGRSDIYSNAIRESMERISSKIAEQFTTDINNIKLN